MRRILRLLCGAIWLAAFPGVGLSGPIEVQGTLDLAGDLKISGTGHGVVFADGTKQTSAAIIYQQIRMVSPVGNPVENGATLLQTLQNILDADKDRRYLVKIEPGIYDIEFNSIEMAAYVDIEGSGEHLTKIKGQVDSAVTEKGVLNGASHAELRFLSVMHTGGVADAIAIYNKEASPAITRVEVSSSGATTRNIGIYNDAAAPRLKGLIVSASGSEEAYGIWNSESAPFISGGRITASMATKKNCAIINNNAYDSGPIMEFLVVEGSGGLENFGISDYAGATVMRHMTVMATGGQDNTAVHCEGTAETELSMVTVIAENGSNINRGIRSSYGLPRITGGSVRASGGTFTTGIYIDHKDLLLQGVDVTASGGTTSNKGIRTDHASPTLIGVTVVAEGPGQTAIGLHSESTGDTVTVSHSSFKGAVYAIQLGGVITLNMGASRLDGPISTYGTWNCTGCFDGSLSPLGSDCQ